MPSRAASGSSSVDDVIDGLYSLDPDDFTSERNEAAKRLKAEGDKDGAGAVKGLRKPTAVAWAVNQLPRRAPKLVEALLDAGASLRSAQRAALSGSAKGGLREATQERRAAVAALVDEASAVFRDAGRNPAPHADSVRLTLEAASSDEVVGELLQAGRFVKEVEPSSGLGDVSGFEVLAGGLASTAAGGEGGREFRRIAATPDRAPSSEASGSTARPSSGKKGSAASRAKAPSPGKESAADARVRERQRAKVAKAEDAVMAARDVAKAARADADAALKEADRLERVMATARRRADRASSAAEKASAKVEEAERALTKAQEDLASLS